MADGFIGHMREQVKIPNAEAISLSDRKISKPAATVLERQDFLSVDVAPMPVFGRGLKAHVTSSCHDEHGMRNLSDPQVMHNYVMSPINKIKKGRNDIVEILSEGMADADVAIVSYGTVSRCARAAAMLARKEGIKVGTVRMVTCWPLPDKEIREIADKVSAMLVLENNTRPDVSLYKGRGRS